MKKSIVILLAAIALPLAAFAQKWEGLADTPPMGWNSWNKFGCNINEQMIREMADAMVSSGLADAGYRYINLDDCWHGTRDADGFIQCDPERFPSGIKALADYVHSKGLKLGIYSDAGYKTCAGKEGSLGHEYQDALQYARWGVDYLKYDWCNAPNINPKGAYTLMRDALRAAGRPIVFSMCEWGSNQPWEWAENVGHLWRATGDIGCSFTAYEKSENWTPLGVLEIVEIMAPLRRYAGPGHWNDPDMLEVGNGMSFIEDRAHFTMWCMFSAPLILGNDLRSMSDQTFSILVNRNVIAIDQDPLGVQAVRHIEINGLQFWFKPLVDGAWAFCILNATEEPKNHNIFWQQFNLTDTDVSGRSTDFAETLYDVYDIWNNRSVGTTKLSKSVIIQPHDVVLYKLTPAKSSGKRR